MSGLPEGWAIVPAGELGDWRGGGTPSKSNGAFWAAGTIPWVSPKDMKRQFISDAEDHITEAAIAGSATQRVPANSILMVTRSGILQHSLPVAINTVPVTVNQDLKTLSPFEGILPEYVLRHLQADAQLILEAASKTGTTVESIDFDRLKAYPIRLAPLPEQKRIVAKVDGLTVRTARARTDLARVPTLIARYKQRLLSLAFSGELTAGWRGKAADVKEWSSGLLSQFATVGTGSTPKRGNPAFYEGGSIPWVTSGVVNDDLVTEASDLITDRAITETNCKVFPKGTLIVAMYGEGQTRGRVATLGIDAATNQALAAIQVISARLNQRFLFWFFKAQYFNLREQAVGGVQPNLSLRLIKALEIPLPTPAEQTEITRRIESAFNWLDRMAADHATAFKLLPKLDGAILAKAFRGELVPQDPKDESASVLLGRIQAERDAAPKALRGRATKNSKDQPMSEINLKPFDRILKDAESWPTDGLVFEEIARRNPIKHDDMRDVLFQLMSGPKPLLQQHFDTSSETMRIRRVLA